MTITYLIFIYVLVKFQKNALFRGLLISTHEFSY